MRISDLSSDVCSSGSAAARWADRRWRRYRGGAGGGRGRDRGAYRRRGRACTRIPLARAGRPALRRLREGDCDMSATAEKAAKPKVTIIEAIAKAYHDAFADDPKVITLGEDLADPEGGGIAKIGRASCRERVCQ